MRRRIPGLALTLLFATTAALAGPVAAQDPFEMPDDSWISLDGTVADVTRDEFTLEYDDGFVRVEMDDGDRDADAYQLLEGDRVTVVGKIDDDFLELAKIEASSVYVEDLGSWFYASAEDEEDWLNMIPEPAAQARTILRGTVTSVGSDDFTIDTGPRQISVEVGGLPYDPLDDEGYQRIEVGDFVSVTGEIDYNLFEGREIEASSIVTVYESGNMP